MTDWAASLESLAWADALRRSVWIYPLVNAGHILGLALLIGSVLPMDVALLRGRLSPGLSGLRVYAASGFILAVLCGALLFAVQATDYLNSPWFLAKLALVTLAVLNAAVHLGPAHIKRPRLAAAASLVFWISALICGRMIGYR